MTGRRCTVDGCGGRMRPHLRHVHELPAGTRIRCGPHVGTVDLNPAREEGGRSTGSVSATFPDRDPRDRERVLSPFTEVEVVDGDADRVWVYDDGGRVDAGFKGHTGDCVTRAVAIATGRPYREVYDSLFDAQRDYAERSRSRKAKRLRNGSASPRLGVYREVFGPYLEALGWTWTPTMQIGSGCTVHLDADELPAGRLVVMVSKHLTAVIDGVVHDTRDPTRGGTRCVYGYWSAP